MTGCWLRAHGMNTRLDQGLEVCCAPFLEGFLGMSLANGFAFGAGSVDGSPQRHVG